MTISEKIEINKKIKTYTGTNSFVLSLQKQLKSNKFLSKELNEKGKEVKVLSDKQYETVIPILEN
jgi:hypothetical protein